MRIKYDVTTYYKDDTMHQIKNIKNGKIGIKCEFKNDNFISDLIVFNTNGIEISRYNYKEVYCEN